MNYLKICVFLVVITALNVVESMNAQSNFEPGYIVNLSGDTITGFIDYKGWDINPKKVFFTKNKTDKPVAYAPMDIKRFNVKKETYISAIVQTENSPTDISRLSDNAELQMSTDTVFLMSFFEGSKSLYYLKKRTGVENFYIWMNNGFELLVYKKYYSSVEDNRSVRSNASVKENNTYRGVLTVYFNNWSEIQSKIATLEYSKKKLYDLFESYYKLEADYLNDSYTLDEAKFEYGAFAGISAANLKTKSSTMVYFDNMEFESSIQPTFGVFADILLPRKLSKFSIYNELMYTAYKIDGFSRYIETADMMTDYTTEFDFSYIKYNCLFRYKIPMKNNSLFLNAGVAVGLAVQSKNNMIRERYLFGAIKTDEKPAITAIRGMEQSLLFGAGFNHKKFGLELRYERGNGFSDIITVKTTSSRFFTVFSYRL